MASNKFWLAQSEKETIRQIILNSLPYVTFMVFGLILSHFVSIRMDEGYSLNTTSKNLTYAWDKALYNELQPPLYFLLLTVWRKISTSLIFARLFSLISVMVGVYYLVETGKNQLKNLHLSKNQLTWLALAQPYGMALGIDIRVYAFGFMITSVMLYTYQKAFLGEEFDKKSAIAYSIWGLMGIASQYYIAVFMLGTGLYLLLSKKWQMWWRYLLAVLPSLILLGMLVPSLLVQASHPSSLETEATSFFIYRRWLVSLLESLTIGTWGYKILIWPGRLVLWGLFIITSVDILQKGWEKSFEEMKPFLFITLNHLLLFSAICVFMGALYVLPHRYHNALYPVLFLSFVAFLFGRTQTKWSRLAFTILLTTYLLSNFFLNRTFNKEGDFRGIVAGIESMEQESQPIFIYKNEFMMCIEPYYSGINELHPFPRPVNYDQPWAYELDLLRNREEIRHLLDSTMVANGQPDQFWLVSLVREELALGGVKINSKILWNEIEKDFEPTYSKVYGLNFKVQLFQRKD
ncbi:MAG: hypothetical protein MRZ79_06710 [Bacteroidia bacterium]|nr:hypothetical protein [Bacteroidia bacterium]